MVLRLHIINVMHLTIGNVCGMIITIKILNRRYPKMIQVYDDENLNMSYQTHRGLE